MTEHPSPSPADAAIPQGPKRCGQIAIVGRPNVGKSTLLNRLVGQKISITARRPQTTRYQILGIRNEGAAQMLFIDTPGLQRGAKHQLGRHMNSEISAALAGADLCVLVTEGVKWLDADEQVLDALRGYGGPVVWVINKLDRLADKRALLPVIDSISGKLKFAVVVPVAGRTGNNVDHLAMTLAPLLPEAEHHFPEDELTDRSARFLAAEFIREKLMRLLGEELPYSLGVVIDDFKQEEQIARIHATIWVSRPGHKAIVVGSKGQVLKLVGEQARKDLEALLGCKVFLRTWVKVKENWMQDPSALKELGFG